MASWKQINELGGTLVLRTVTGAFSLLLLYGLAKTAYAGTFTLYKLGMLAAALALFGGYTIYGTRLTFRGR